MVPEPSDLTPPVAPPAQATAGTPTPAKIRSFTDMSDEELMGRYQSFECESSFQVIHSRWWTRIRNWFIKRLDEPSKAEDLTQHVFMRLIGAAQREGYDPDRNFGVWIHTIAWNLHANSCREASRRRIFTESDLGREETVDIYERASLSGASNEMSPLEVTHNAQLRERIFAAIRELPEDFQKPFLMHEIEGLPYDEIAEALGIPVGTVKSRMNRARKQIRGYLEDLRDHFI